MITPRIKLKPYTLVIRTTERCNVGCFHCSISATPKGSDIDLALAIQVIEEAKINGLNRVHFTGGEPLLYENLEELVSKTRELEMYHDITSSTFTNPGENTIRLLERLKDNGLECVMLSYDQPHSKSVSISQFTEFTKRSLELDLHVCVFVTEGGNATFKTEDLKLEFLKENIDLNEIEWSISEYQFEGRGKKFSDHASKVETSQYCRCPYVMTVPTLTPNGDVLLCHMSRFKTENFTVGNYPAESFKNILIRMETSPLYRYLSKHGPQQSLLNLGFSRAEVPDDMCRACEKYLSILEIQEYQEKLDELLVNDDLCEIEVDFIPILPIYQRYLLEHGEKIDS